MNFGPQWRISGVTFQRNSVWPWPGGSFGWTGLPSGPACGRNAGVGIESIEVQRLAHGFKIGRGKLWHRVAKSFQAIFRISAKDNGIGIPARIPSVLDLHGGLAARLDVFGFVGDGIAKPADRSPSDVRLLFRAGSNRLNSQAMREQSMMRRQQDFVEAKLQPRRMLADRMPEVQKALRFVESDPTVDTVGETIHNDFDVVGRTISDYLDSASHRVRKAHRGNPNERA